MFAQESSRPCLHLGFALTTPYKTQSRATNGKRMLYLYLWFFFLSFHMLENEGLSVHRSYENLLNVYILSWKNPDSVRIASLFCSIQHRARSLIMSFPTKWYLPKSGGGECVG